MDDLVAHPLAASSDPIKLKLPTQIQN